MLPRAHVVPRRPVLQDVLDTSPVISTPWPSPANRAAVPQVHGLARQHSYFFTGACTADTGAIAAIP